MTIYKYEAAGNDFLIIVSMEKSLILSKEEIVKLCDRRKGIGADGLIIIGHSENYDFEMLFYNNDGSGGMFCGNGGRAVVDLANRLNIPKKDNTHTFTFGAPDGLHKGSVWNSKGNHSTVMVTLGDVGSVETITIPQNDELEQNGYILNTGCPHLILFAKGELDHLDVYTLGRYWRYHQLFAPNGINVDFVSIETPDKIKIRTYERGVEYETPSCGTGVVASAIATFIREKENLESKKYFVETRQNNFITQFNTDESLKFNGIELTGPTNFVFKVDVEPASL